MFPLLRLASCKTSGERPGVIVCPLKEQKRGSRQTKYYVHHFQGRHIPTSITIRFLRSKKS